MPGQHYVSRRQFARASGFGFVALVSRQLTLAEDNDSHFLLAQQSVTSDADLVFGDSLNESEHWRNASNSGWIWYEREALVDGEWKLTGITTPVNIETGERYAEETGYLDESLVPESLRGHRSIPSEVTHARFSSPHDTDGEGIGFPNIERRSRHGRPASEWLRNLDSDELRIWLKTVRVPQAGVSGMSFWTHLTRDHSFEANKINGLNETEQELLHSAAHHGY